MRIGGLALEARQAAGHAPGAIDGPDVIGIGERDLRSAHRRHPQQLGRRAVGRRTSGQRGDDQNARGAPREQHPRDFHGHPPHGRRWYHHSTAMKERRITAFRVLLGVVLLVALAYVGGIVWLVTQETRLVFRAGVAMGALRPAQPYEQHDHTPDDGSPQPDGRVWLMPTATDSDDHPWVIFLHGNGSTLASRLNILHYERLRALGLNVAAPEYRGYGGLAG